MNRNREISLLTARYLAGEMNSKEENKFLQMMVKDENQKSEFQSLKETWTTLESNPATEIPDSREAWIKLHNRLENDGLLTQTPIRSFNSVNIYLKIAASILIFLAITIPSYYLLNNDPLKNGSIAYVAENSVSTYDLPDGSRVFLKGGSEIDLPGDFLEQRRVNLKGEAYFEIMADPSHPLSIHTKNASISVLGTSFNVKENKSSDETEVMVETGKVKVNNPKGQEIFLNPGQFVRAGKNNIQLEVNKDQNYLSWKTREFHFNNQKLNQVFSLLEEVYQVKIDVLDEDILEFRLTSSYNKQSIDAILKTIGTAFDLKITRERNAYEVIKN
jgi:ferric-dicitrate binding protein FerR (iron transport regulator)